MTSEKLLKKIKECLIKDNNESSLVNDIKKLEKKNQDKGLYTSLLKILTHLEFSPNEAKEYWEKILEHKHFLSEKIGRDPGIRVSILDYFSNVDSKLKSPKVIELLIYEETERNALLDGLTELYNKKYFKQALENALKTSIRYDEPVSLILCDLDDFKDYNDTYGHLNGDRLLVAVSKLIKENFRPSDIVARCGGEEFAIILPNTDKFGVVKSAERLLWAVRNLKPSKHGVPKSTKITLSCGIASCPIDATSTDTLFVYSDKALYQSKFEGKDKITLFSSEKRRHFRVVVNKPINYIRRTVAKRLGSLTLINISASGAALASKAKIPPMTELMLLINVGDNKEPIELVGKVLWERKESRGKYILGIHFIQMDTFAKEKIIEFVEDKRCDEEEE